MNNKAQYSRPMESYVRGCLYGIAISAVYPLRTIKAVIERNGLLYDAFYEHMTEVNGLSLNLDHIKSGIDGLQHLSVGLTSDLFLLVTNGKWCSENLKACADSIRFAAAEDGVTEYDKNVISEQCKALLTAHIAIDQMLDLLTV